MLRDLNTAMGLGNPIPQEYRRASTVEITGDYSGGSDHADGGYGI